MTLCLVDKSPHRYFYISALPNLAEDVVEVPLEFLDELCVGLELGVQIHPLDCRELVQRCQRRARLL